MELERISNIECWQPSNPSEPKITPGRLRTLSAPFKEDMLSLPYSWCFLFAIANLRHYRPKGRFSCFLVHMKLVYHILSMKRKTCPCRRLKFVHFINPFLSSTKAPCVYPFLFILISPAAGWGRKYNNCFWAHFSSKFFCKSNQFFWIIYGNIYKTFKRQIENNETYLYNSWNIHIFLPLCWNFYFDTV